MKSKRTKSQTRLKLFLVKVLPFNAWSTWDRSATELWRSLAGRLGPRPGMNPRDPLSVLAALGDAAGDTLDVLESDPAFQKLLERTMSRFRWVLRPRKPPAGLSARRPVAYFSMEFGVHETLAVYAGGLGILAGDHAKSASDEAVPLVGVGLFYHNGYFRQELDGKGEQRDTPVHGQALEHQHRPPFHLCRRETHCVSTIDEAAVESDRNASSKLARPVPARGAATGGDDPTV